MTETADVIVVGAGVQGASLAFHLARHGASVVVLERETVAAGAQPGTGVADAHVRLRASVAHLDADREPGPDLAAAAELVHGGALAELAGPSQPRVTGG